MPRAKRIKLKRNLPRIKSHQKLHNRLVTGSLAQLVEGWSALATWGYILSEGSGSATVNLGFFLFLIIKSIFLDFSLLFLDYL